MKDVNFISIDDDRDNLEVNEQPILIIEDDLNFAEILLDYAHENRHKAVILNRGDLAMQYVERYNPKTIILDIQLPGSNGWTILKELKSTDEYQDVPIHVVSAIDKEKLGKELGAVSYNVKPINPTQLDRVFNSISETTQNSLVFKCIIVGDIVDNNDLITSINKYFSVIIYCEKPAQALTIIKSSKSDFMLVIDVGVGDTDIVEFLEKTNNLSSEKCKHIHLLFSEEMNVKERAYTNLIDVNFLNPLESIDVQLKKIIGELRKDDVSGSKLLNAEKENVDSLSGKKILIVDDEYRNIFALESVLEDLDLEIFTADNGKKAIEVLESESDISLVLMDIMMPIMNGYEAMEIIREMPEFENLPIIALTAKAMRGDMENCIAAGASDYITKPIDIEKLLKQIKNWI